MDREYFAHLLPVIDKLEQVGSGKIKRLIIELPPRVGKSTLVSQHFLAWYKEKHPEENILLATYEAALARRHANIAKDICEKAGVEVVVKQCGWNTVDGGWVYPFGVGGATAGRGGNLIIDDPTNNDKGARSETQRNLIYDWYKVMTTRINPGGFMVIVASRWHVDDLIGRLKKDMKNGGEQWEVVTMPIISEDDKPLWESRYSIEEIKELKRRLGIDWFEALYMQNPQDIEQREKEKKRIIELEGNLLACHLVVSNRREMTTRRDETIKKLEDQIFELIRTAKELWDGR